MAVGVRVAVGVAVLVDVAVAVAVAVAVGPLNPCPLSLTFNAFGISASANVSAPCTDPTVEGWKKTVT